MAKQPPKILIVEDDNQLSMGLKISVTKAGFTALVAKDGEVGLKTALKNKPDLILLDVIMPKMDGIKMLKKLRQDPWGKDALVILLSNDDDPTHISETLRDNATDYLIKSDWSLEDIIGKIKETLGIT